MAFTKRQKLGLSAAAGVVVLLLLRNRRSEVVVNTPRLPIDQTKALIKSEAKRQGVDPRLALAFADLESGFQSDAIGDRNWPFSGDRFQRFVLDNPRYSANPFRDRPGLWVSYGLFQLLAAFELWREDPNGDPRILADPTVNVRLAIAKIKRIQDLVGNDPLKIRLTYVGCRKGQCGPSKVLRVARRFAIKSRNHGLDIGEPAEVVSRAQALA